MNLWEFLSSSFAGDEMHRRCSPWKIHKEGVKDDNKEFLSFRRFIPCVFLSIQAVKDIVEENLQIEEHHHNRIAAGLVQGNSTLLTAQNRVVTG